MTVTYLTEYNTKFYAVTFQNNGYVRVRKFEYISNHEYNLFFVKPLGIFLGKSHTCYMTIMSRALDKSVFDGNTILLKIGEEKNKNKNVYIGGDTICSFLTNDTIYE